MKLSIKPFINSRNFKYFKSNILLSQEGEYAGAGIRTVLWRRVEAFLHIGSGRDGFFAGTPVMSVLAYLGLLSVISGLFGGKPGAKAWERLAAVWFVGTIAGASAPGESGLHHGASSGIIGI